MVRTFLFSVLLVLANGCVIERTGTSVWGTYTTFKPSYVDQVITERSYKGRVYPLPAVMLYLRENGTYVFGFCDNQISEAGRYTIKDDSILLSDRFDLDDRIKFASIYIHRENKNGQLFIITEKKDLNGKISKKIIPLKRNHKKAHLGYLRGQEMELDSIIHYYKQHTVDEQNIWSDSVVKSLITKT